MDVPKDIIEAVHVGGGDDYPDYGSRPGQITDFNLWNKALSINEMISWTNCK